MKIKNVCHVLVLVVVVAAGAGAAHGQSQPERQQPTRSGETARPASKDTTRGQSSSNLSGADQAFVREAAEGGMTEVALGRLALERASSADVKQFAQRMVDDHTRANQELMQIAQGKGVTLSQDLSDTQSGARGGREQAGQQATQQSERQAGQQASRQSEQQAGQQTGTQAGRSSDHHGGMPKSAREAVDRLSKHSGADFDRVYMGQMVKDHEKTLALFEREAEGGGDADLKGFASKTLPTLREHAQQARDLAAKVGASSDRR